MRIDQIDWQQRAIAALDIRRMTRLTLGIINFDQLDIELIQFGQHT